MRFEIGESGEVITTHAGLSLVGELLAKTQIKQRLSATELPGQVAPHVSHGDVALSYIGLLCQGKSDFDHIAPYRRDQFYRLSLGLREVPSSPTLRQRLDLAASSADWPTTLREESADLLHRMRETISPVQRYRHLLLYLPWRWTRSLPQWGALKTLLVACRELQQELWAQSGLPLSVASAGSIPLSQEIPTHSLNRAKE